MAKKKTVAAKKLMPAGKVVVKSRTYGVHERAARGSKTPVAINEVLQKNVAKTVVVTGVAKRVHDLLKICGEHFKETMLWQEMLGRMRKAASDDMMGLLMTLKGMELNGKYKLDRFAKPHIKDVEWSKKGCEMVMSKGYPHWKYGDTEYCYEVFLLTLGKEAEKDGLVSAVSGWIKKEEKEGEIRFEFVVPLKVDYYVVCLHFMTGKDGKETGTLASRGMKVVKVGKGKEEEKKKKTSR